MFRPKDPKHHVVYLLTYLCEKDMVWQLNHHYLLLHDFAFAPQKNVFGTLRERECEQASTSSIGGYL
jgi:hypothetical protein